jgi:hypothetical protein
MLSNAMAQEQIFWSIVMLDEVDMVNALVRSQGSSQNSFHDQSVFHLTPYNSVRISMGNPDVSALVGFVAVASSEWEPELVGSLRGF